MDVDGAKIVIGKASVAAPITITASVSSDTSPFPRAAHLRGKVYDFGPSGTKFEKPVFVSLPVGDAIPPGKQRNVAYLDTVNNEWIPLGSQLVGTHVVALTDHFTVFALLETTAFDATEACPPKPACGGAVGAHYDIAAACPTGAPPEETATELCTQAGANGTSVSVYRVAGTMSFDPTGTAALRSLSFAAFTKYTLQATCVAFLGQATGTPTTTCQQAGDIFTKFTDIPALCEGDPASACTCFTPSGVDEKLHVGTYAAAGNVMSLTDAGSTNSIDYCIDQGNLHFTNAGEYELIYAP